MLLKRACPEVLPQEPSRPSTRANFLMAAKKQTNKAKSVPTSSVVARLDDGTVQVTMTIAQSLVEEKKELALKQLIEELQVPGFRKGKAPKDAAIKHIEQQKLYEHMLRFLLPEAYAQAVEQHNLRPILAPRFELVSVDDNTDWTVRAITCELPSIDVKDYKKALTGKGKAKIAVPGKKDDDESKADTTRAEQEQEVIKVLLETSEANIPDILLEEEVNHKLSGLIDQLQKVGLTIERYLAQTGKSAEQIKEEYKRQSAEAIKLELVLNTIAAEEAIVVGDDEVEAVAATMEDPSTGTGQDKEQTKRVIRSILLQRKTLDRLISYL
jgi:FKBP-type peptidyl-prolyl cis-trans isomerase (trigger factor)